MAFEEKNQDLIERFVNGTLSEAELKAFDERCQKDVAFAREVGLYLAIQQAAQQPNLEEIEAFTAQQEKKRGTARNQWWGIILIISLLLLGGLYYFTREAEPPEQLKHEQIFANNFEKPRDTLILKDNQLTQRVSSSLDDGAKNRLKVAIEKFYEANYQAASEDLKALTGQYGDIFMANFYLGCSYIYLEEYELALVEFENVRDGLPFENNEDIHDQTTWYEALANVKLNRVQTARLLLQELIDNETVYKEKAEDILNQIQ